MASCKSLPCTRSLSYFLSSTDPVTMLPIDIPCSIVISSFWHRESVLLVWLSCAPKWILFSPNATWVSLQKTAESTTFTTCGRFCLYKHSCVSLSSLSKLLWSVEHTLCIGTFMNTKVHFSSTFMKDDICISTFLLMLQRISRRRNGEMMDTIPFVIIISTTWWLQTARLVADTTDPSNWNGHRIIGLFFHNENILNISIRETKTSHPTSFQEEMEDSFLCKQLGGKYCR